MSALKLRVDALDVCQHCQERFTVDYQRGMARNTPCAANWQHEYTRRCKDCGSGTTWTQEAWGDRETCDGCGATHFISIGD